MNSRRWADDTQTSAHAAPMAYAAAFDEAAWVIHDHAGNALRCGLPDFDVAALHGTLIDVIAV